MCQKQVCWSRSVYCGMVEVECDITHQIRVFQTILSNIYLTMRMLMCNCEKDSSYTVSKWCVVAKIDCQCHISMPEMDNVKSCYIIVNKARKG